MGDLRMCFDASAYNRALADVENIGYISSDERTDLTGKYYCDDSIEFESEKELILIDKNKRFSGYSGSNKPFWADSAGRMFDVIRGDTLPDGVLAVAWNVTGDDLMLQSLREFYNCELKNDKKCVKRVATESNSKHEEYFQASIKETVEKGDAFWTKAQELIDLAEYCDKGPGGIDPDDLREIRDDYPVTKKKGQQTYAEANEYLKKAEEMFEKMVMNFSGFESIREKGKRIGCEIDRTVTHYESCWSGSIQKGFDIVRCSDINFSSESIKFSNDDCREKPMPGKY